MAILFPENPYEHGDEPMGEPEPPTACLLSMPGCEGDATTKVFDGDEKIDTCANCADWWLERIRPHFPGDAA